MDTPMITYCMKKASVEKELLAVIDNVMDRSGLPHFMLVDILRAALVAEYQKAYSELANDSESTIRQTHDYYKEKMKEMEEAAENEKKELINAFENHESIDMNEQA